MLPSVTLFSMDLTSAFSPMLSFIHYTDCVRLLLFLFALENSLFFHNANSNMWLVNTQAGEELCLGS